jgi:hypothetical protein
MKEFNKSPDSVNYYKMQRVFVIVEISSDIFFKPRNRWKNYKKHVTDICERIV